MGPAYLPEPVSTIMAEAKLLKEASTAPIAIASAGSVQGGVERRRSSNTCRWNMAASASRAIWHTRGQDASSGGIPTTGTGRGEIKEIGGENKWETEKDNVRDIQRQQVKVQTKGDGRRGQEGHYIELGCSLAGGKHQC